MIALMPPILSKDTQLLDARCEVAPSNENGRAHRRLRRSMMVQQQQQQVMPPRNLRPTDLVVRMVIPWVCHNPWSLEGLERMVAPIDRSVIHQSLRNYWMNTKKG